MACRRTSVERAWPTESVRGERAGGGREAGPQAGTGGQRHVVQSAYGAPRSRLQVEASASGRNPGRNPGRSPAPLAAPSSFLRGDVHGRGVLLPARPWLSRPSLPLLGRPRSAVAVSRCPRPRFLSRALVLRRGRVPGWAPGAHSLPFRFLGPPAREGVSGLVETLPGGPWTGSGGSVPSESPPVAAA